MAGRPYTELVGGPFDGLLCARRSDPFIYYGLIGDSVRRYQDPGPGRHLYRLARDGNWVYAGHQYHRCGGCGAIIGTPECEICLHTG